MSVRKNKTEDVIDYSVYDQNVTDVITDEYVREITVRYGVNVSVFRACPSLLDGLTPGQRRRLYVAYKLGAMPDKPRRKVDTLLGPVTAYHPHGSQSIEKSFTNEIKEWESPVLLYDVQGNSGSVSGQNAAAVRYLEARLSIYAYKCFFEEFDPDIIDMVPSNTKVDMEPVTIPSRYPNFLLGLTTGIAWGNSVNVPPFNVTEVFELTKKLIKTPKMRNVHLYPDSPRGYDIIENDNIQQICDAGKGTLKIQARMDYHEEKDAKGKVTLRYIEVYGFPDRTNMEDIMMKIAKLVTNKTITGIDNLANKTHLKDVRFWVVLDKTADPKFVMDMLYRKTQLRYHLSINFNFAGRTEMQPLGLKDALLVWIENRIDVKQRVYIKKLSRSKERLHVVEGILIMLDPSNVDKTIRIIKDSNTDEDSINGLMKEYGCTSYQASIVNDTKLSKIKRDSRKQYKEELKELEDKIEELSNIVTSRDKIKEIIIDELDEGIKLFGKPRYCRIIDPEALDEVVHKFNIIITKKYIKKVSVNCTNVGVLDSDDEVVTIFSGIKDTEQIYIADNLGKIYRVCVNKLTICDLANKGDDLLSLLGIKGSVVTSFIDDGKNVENSSLIMFMKSGIIKRTMLSQYISNRSVLQGALLNDDDEVSYAIVYDPTYQNAKSQYALAYTTNGVGICIKLDSITITDRITKGSRYLALANNDTIQGICCGVTGSDDIFVLTTKGNAKKCKLDEIFKTTKRRAEMIRLTGLGEGDSVFRIIPIEKDDKRKVTCILQSGVKVDIALDEVKTTTRISKGFKMVPVKRGDAIIKLKLS